ncbi:hypothetical protein Tco_0466415 [Tanacetum coccineum]
MTGNKSYLTDYQDIDRGFVAFAGSPKGGKITGKGVTIGTKFKISEMNLFCEIRYRNQEEFCVARTPQQNGVAERKNNTTNRGARLPNLGFMIPFVCPVTILNTLDHLDKFEGKADEGSGPEWLFDIDSLTKSLNYEPVSVGNQTNDDASPKSSDDKFVDDAGKKNDAQYLAKDGDKNGHEKDVRD